MEKGVALGVTEVLGDRFQRGEVLIWGRGGISSRMWKKNGFGEASCGVSWSQSLPVTEILGANQGEYGHC